MAHLLTNQNSHPIYLRVSHSFGRDPAAADTYLPNPQCSRLHCTIFYQNDAWFIIDNSKNGTFVNQQPLNNKERALHEGDQISFPGKDDTLLTLADCAPPKPFLLNSTTQEVIQLEHNNILPNDDAMELLLTKQGNAWIVEKEENVQEICTKESIVFSGQAWNFFANDLIHATVTHVLQSNSQTMNFRFFVSLNEENIRLVLEPNGEKIDCGYRSHHQILLALARQRITDQEAGLQPLDIGWTSTDLLLKELGLTANHFNIHIYRARKAFQEMKLPNMPFERRQGEIRLCPCEIVINKGHTSIHTRSV
ncbi:FHA domain-containing protein [Marinibactrum halimedae]|uniref:FHA domain-containing protein n=1 Tax=Marinibactrum halimedae TaxID=1444977 RepID=A0AA37T8C2_9GAMM|nr:FHA domain-containing protein [Marinibactrum halimedae]MCD9458185.1 FHA domain-containing protein [Marinibactrum halimedae]GLS25120.1 hypothetical protein GCM10007877_08340 [Marinibactrum halimedae]